MSSIVTANLTRVVRVTDTSILVITGTQDLSGYQPLDSDLTAIAALTTTSFGRSTLTLADAAAMRTQSGLGTLATQNGTFSGTSSGTNTGDQDLGGLLTISGAAETYAPLDLPVFPAGITLGVEGLGDGIIRLYSGALGEHQSIEVGDESVFINTAGESKPAGGFSLENNTEYQYVFSANGITAVRGVTVRDEDGVLALAALEKSANFTPIVGGVYLATATLTVTDPTPSQGAEFTVIVRNGTATVGPTAYATAGTVIRRIYHSGAWENYSGSVAIGSVTGLGTGVATALAVNVGSAGAPVVLNGALGTPSSGTVTNLTGTASININGTVGATTATTGAFTTVTTSGLVRVGGATSSFPALKANGAVLQARLADDSAYAQFNSGNITSGVSGQGSITVTNSSSQSVIQMSGSVNYGYHASSTVCHSWGNGTALNGTLDTSLSRVSAGVVGVGSGGSAGDVTGELRATIVNSVGTTESTSTTTGALRTSGGLGVAKRLRAAVVSTTGYTVATLPAGTVGDCAYVTDALAPTYLGALVGGGAITCPVFYNGAAWVSA